MDESHNIERYDELGGNTLHAVFDAPSHQREFP